MGTNIQPPPDFCKCFYKLLIYNSLNPYLLTFTLTLPLCLFRKQDNLFDLLAYCHVMILYILREMTCITSAIFFKKIIPQRWANLRCYSHDIRKGVLRLYHLREHHKMTDILIRNSHTAHITKAFGARLEIICIFMIFRPLEDIHPSIIHLTCLVFTHSLT